MKWRSVSRKTRTILKKAKKGWIKKLITRVGYVKEVKEEPVLEKKETSKKSSKYLKEGLMSAGAVLGASTLMSNEVYAATEKELNAENTTVTKDQITIKDENYSETSEVESTSTTESESESSSENKSESKSESQSSTESTSESTSDSQSLATSEHENVEKTANSQADNSSIKEEKTTLKVAKVNSVKKTVAKNTNKVVKEETVSTKENVVENVVSTKTVAPNVVENTVAQDVSKNANVNKDEDELKRTYSFNITNALAQASYEIGDSKIASTSSKQTSLDKIKEEVSSYSIYANTVDINGHMQSDLAANNVNCNGKAEIGSDTIYDETDKQTYIGHLSKQYGSENIMPGTATNKIIFSNEKYIINGKQQDKFVFTDKNGNYITSYTDKNGKHDAPSGYVFIFQYDKNGNREVYTLQTNAYKNGLTLTKGENPVNMTNITKYSNDLINNTDKVPTIKPTITETGDQKVTIDATTSKSKEVHVNLTFDNGYSVKTESGQTTYMFNQNGKVNVIVNHDKNGQATQTVVVNFKYNGSKQNEQNVVFDVQKLIIDGVGSDRESNSLGIRHTVNAVVYNFGDFKGVVNLAGSFCGTIIAPNAKVVVNATGTGSIYADRVVIQSGEWHSTSSKNQKYPSHSESTSESKSKSESESKSKSESESLSKSESESLSKSESISRSKSESKSKSKSESESTKKSKSESKSRSKSESASKSKSESESISRSESESRSKSESESTSRSKSESESESKSKSESESTSRSESESKSKSES
ncbi:hypothetical protein SAMN04487759_12530, partial [Kandleria vitulina]